MPKLVLQSNLLKGADRGVFVWSITNILFATSAFCVLIAALVQYFVLTSLSVEFRRLYEIESSARVLAQVETYRPRFGRLMQAGGGQGAATLAGELLGQDVGYQILVLYRPDGSFFSMHHRENVPQNQVAALNQRLGLSVLGSRIDSSRGIESSVRVVDAKTQRTVDALLPLFVAGDRGRPTKLGFLRVLVSLGQVDDKLQQMRLLGAVLVIVTTALSTLLFLVIIRKTVTDPIERAVALMEFVVEDMVRIPPLDLRTTDALQVKQLMRALHAGLSEISIRHRSTSLVEVTRKAIEESNDDSLLVVLRDIWVESKLALACQIVLVRLHPESKRYLVEQMTPAYDGEKSRSIVGRRLRNMRQTQHLDLQRDLMAETVLKFMGTGQEIDWTDRWLLVRSPFQILSEGHTLVLALVPNEETGVTPDRFEELSILWLSEVSRLYQEVRYRSIAGEIELARELQRKWIQVDGRNDAPEMAHLDPLFAADSVSSSQAMNDFLFAIKIPGKCASLVVLGSLASREVRGALAATGIVGALSDRFQSVRGAEPQRLLKGMLTSINAYLWSIYKGQLVAGAVAIHFDHDKGLGLFSSYGLKYPLLFTPHERKPMVIAQSETCSALGSSENLNFVSTSFPVYAGQIVVAMTPGILEVENPQGQRFEKALLSGGLSEVVDSYYQEPAKVMLQKFVEKIREHAGTRVVGSDLTAVVLMRKPLGGETV
jgi:hypothetical protein